MTKSLMKVFGPRKTQGQTEPITAAVAPSQPVQIEQLVVDPQAMNITNRIASGTVITGNYSSKSGLLVQGEIIGNIFVQGGPLVLTDEGVIRGNIFCEEDAFLCGTIAPDDGQETPNLEFKGKVVLAHTLNAKANIQARSFKTFEGAQIDGLIRTVRSPVAIEQLVDHDR